MDRWRRNWNTMRSLCCSWLQTKCRAQGPVYDGPRKAHGEKNYTNGNLLESRWFWTQLDNLSIYSSFFFFRCLICLYASYVPWLMTLCRGCVGHHVTVGQPRNWLQFRVNCNTSQDLASWVDGWKRPRSICRAWGREWWSLWYTFQCITM